MVVWLNMALQPCAMAMALDIGQADETAGHVDHTAHDSNAQEMPCHNNASDCSVFDEFSFDGRTAKVNAKYDAIELPAGIVASAISVLPINCLPGRYRRGELLHLPGEPPPLNVLYCVYLD